MKARSKIYGNRLKQLVILFAAICLILPLQASSLKDDTDFSGTWTLNDSKSNLAGRGFGIAKKLDITQDGNTLTIVRTLENRDGDERTMTNTYTIGGKENDTSFGRRNSTTVLNWSDDGKALTFTTNSTFNRNGQNYEAKSTEVWTLGDDGKILKIDHSMSTPRGERSSSLVYDKQ